MREVIRQRRSRCTRPNLQSPSCAVFDCVVAVDCGCAQRRQDSHRGTVSNILDSRWPTSCWYGCRCRGNRNRPDVFAVANADGVRAGIPSWYSISDSGFEAEG